MSQEEYEQAKQDLISQRQEAEITIDQFRRDMEDLRVEYKHEVRGRRI